MTFINRITGHICDSYSQLDGFNVANPAKGLETPMMGGPSELKAQLADQNGMIFAYFMRQSGKPLPDSCIGRTFYWSCCFQHPC
jgi:hypothetical protein